MYILIYARGSNDAIGRAAPPQQAGEDYRAHTHKALSLARRDDGGSPLCRRRGLGHEPVEIAAVDALDRKHQDRGRGVGVHLLDRRADGPRERAAGLDDHHHLLAALDRTLPPIVRDHAGEDVDARAQALLDQCAAGPLRLDNRGIGRIDEDRALHVHHLAGRGRRLPADCASISEAPRVPMTRPAMSPATQSFKRIAFVASPIPEAREALERLAARYGNVAAKNADVIVALGGDGLMLQTLHRFMTTGKPIYGMHRGTVGFLMNEFHPDQLPERLAKAQVTVIHPLLMRAHDSDGDAVEFHAFNDVFLYRQTYQAARLRILIDGEERLSELVADGVLVATPAGSTAYNLSAQGPIIPISAPLMALTPISPFRPRRWRGALLPDSARVRVEVLEPEKRPVAAVADHDEVRSVSSVDIQMDHSISMQMLFDPGHSLDERIVREQFGY